MAVLAILLREDSLNSAIQVALALAPGVPALGVDARKVLKIKVALHGEGRIVDIIGTKAHSPLRVFLDNRRGLLSIVLARFEEIFEFHCYWPVAQAWMALE